MDPGSSSSPIRITFAPPAGSTARVGGTVEPDLCADHRVLVYLNVRGCWGARSRKGRIPFTRIEPDGTWRCTILTGGEDRLASEVAAYLVPSTLTAPPRGTGARLPTDRAQGLPVRQRKLVIRGT